jgi:hypothetical protein
MQTPTNHYSASLQKPMFSSSFRETKDSSPFSSSSSALSLLLKAPMIDTPESEKNMRNDLRYLMIADMIDTPESEKIEPIPLDFTPFSTFNFDDHDRMICHQDFPRRLVAFTANQVRDDEKTNGNDLFNKKSIIHSIREAKTMKIDNTSRKSYSISESKTMKINNTSRKSHSISEAKTMKINNTSRKSRDGASMNPTKLFASQLFSSNMMVKKVINWQDKLPTRKSMKIGALFQKKAKRAGGKRHIGRSLVRSDFLHKKIRLAITPTQTITSDEAIALTPHPFKTPKQMNDIHLPPSAVFVNKNMEPVSEIACRSRPAVFSNLAGSSNVNGNGKLSLIDLMTIDEVCPDRKMNDADKKNCLNEDPRRDDDSIKKEADPTEKILHVAFV